MKRQAAPETKLEIYYSRPKCLGWFLVYLSCCFGLGFLPFISGYVLSGAVLGLFFGAAALQHLICIFIPNRESFSAKRFYPESSFHSVGMKSAVLRKCRTRAF